MQDVCPTVIVKGQKGDPLVINLSDYDEKKYELFEKKDAFDREAMKTFLDEKKVKYSANISNKKLQALCDETKNVLSVVEHEGGFIIANGMGDQIGEESYTTVEEAETMLKMLTGK